MSGKNRFPVLTAITCNLMENLRLAIEVFEGESVRFIQLDFNNERGRIRIGEEERDFSFYQPFEDTICFWWGHYHPLNNQADWNSAYIREGGVINVSNDSNPKKLGIRQHEMWWVGRSATDRREEPVRPEEVEYWAKQHGLTVEEYLK